MKSRIIILLLSFILILLFVQILCRKESVEQEPHQKIVVTVSEKTAVLSFYEKDSGGRWVELLQTPAVIGKNGIGKTKEGDLKTPVGTYHFIKAFGIKEDPGSRLPYVQVDENDYWIDDVNSQYYNQFVSEELVEPDWTSGEHLCEYGKLYHYVLATSYNEACIPGLGSAVFLHCASEETQYTAGCIAIDEECMKKILQMVEEDCVLIIGD